MTGNSLITVAQALADAQTKGPTTQDQLQIGLNQKQTAAAEKATSGYFNQLGQFVNQGNQQLGQIATGLNTQLQGIGDQTQQQISKAFTPGQGLQNLAAQGLASGALGSLAADGARQQGFAAQDAGAYRAAGASQGANYRSLGASNLGTFALKGQETLGKIGQAGQLENVPLTNDIAKQNALNGAYFAKALGSMRQQEIANGITRAGLGIKSAQLANTVQNDQANRILKLDEINATLRGQDIQQQKDTLSNQLGLINARISQGNLDEKTRHDLATERQALQKQQQKLTGATNKPLTPVENNHLLGTLDRFENQITAMRQGGIVNTSTHTITVNGQQFAPGATVYAKPTDDQIRSALTSSDPTGGVLAQAAFELNQYGAIAPSTAAQLHQMGVRGGYFRGRPIKVQAPPPGFLGSLGNLLNVVSKVK